MKKQILLILGLNLLAVIVTCAVFAATGLPWEAPITTLRTSLTGPVAFGIALIAIMITGGMLIFGGEFNEFAKRGSYVVLVLGLLVTAQNALAVFFPAVAGAGAII
ncbi:MAG: TrbC/VirB2 family protein [Proteobacteria bacterium]|nr:TrbC/VirB2 family protein [Pseudomonadota bacterium]MBU1586284.1 TrbC/VirB2 family protein [Pseudomonadota bacterium]MBU2453180.1 TrbC/VirB2 family protein [Pseudomonadota bacterium]MBU2630789.1 TrbC/VirB2 family protein [Pseudomonadota bacterium]